MGRDPPEGADDIVVGREQIVQGFRELFVLYRSFDAQISAVYPAADAHDVVVEYSVKALLSNGETYSNRNIAVFEFQRGKIAVYHDYFDPRRYQRVVDALARAQTQPSRGD